MKEKSKLIIIVCLIICITLLLGEFIYLKYNSNNKTEKNKKEIVIDKDSEQGYFETEKIEDAQNDVNSDEEVVSYIDTVVDDIVEDKAPDENESKLKNTFITLTDFIFYGGTIKGYTFKELREEQKQKVIAAWEKLDAKIESKYPNYKENLKEKKDDLYSNLKEKMTSLKENISDKAQEKLGDEIVDQAKSDTDNLKDVTSQYKEKASEYYNKGKEKVSDWYNNYKNNKE